MFFRIVELSFENLILDDFVEATQLGLMLQEIKKERKILVVMVVF